MENPVLSVKNLTVAYDGKPVLENITGEIKKGSLTAIIGPNGAGKTTFLKAIMGLLKPLSGEVTFGFEDKERKTKIAYVPQTGSTDRDFPVTVFDVALMGRYPHLGWFKRPKKKDREIAFEMLKKVGMEKYVHRQIGTLSGGQEQRVFLARALAQQAKLYFLDEPFKGVDAATEKVIVEMLREIREQGGTVVVVHHDLNTVKKYFDSVIMINKTLVCWGDTESCFNEKTVSGTFKTDIFPEMKTSYD